jgi:glutaredoxin
MISQVFLPILAAAALLAAGAAQAQAPAPAPSEGPPVPFEIARLQKDFAVTLYTAPNCKDPCEKARAALNKRSVPFSEVQVWNEETSQKLKSVSGADQLPVLVVGRSVLTGFAQDQFDDLLSTAGYPAAGLYPPRNQAAPPPPEGDAKPAAAAKPAPGPKPGPYDTSGLVGPAPKPGPYDPSGLKGPTPKPGPYGIPGESK